ncbi:uncharacterized protein LOC131157467 [Malania oleifera]|uniref:uncharacterized protein LOC131157467 n=1 Tax=Malania oleifera TaxID=397392 RepID=UPI0025AE2C66|nr:uncharacterized protein LOC131157467 [Malania oleifera]
MVKEWVSVSPASERGCSEGASAGSGGGAWWATNTLVALLAILLWHLARHLYFSLFAFRSPTKPSLCPPASPQLRIVEIISDADLQTLINNLDEKNSESDRWENVIDKKKDNLSYKVKCCKPKDGPLKYMSWTIFENCSTELLRDFYMDNGYRKLWDKTVVEHEQLLVDETNGIEIGRTIKKFPFLTPREYVLAWRLWEGRDKSFYCFIKECEHPSVPRQKKYVRVEFFRSGWRIRKVPGRNACEIKLVHQEDAGLNVEMAKLAFAKGIWSYICRMDTALRGYSASSRSQQNLAVTAVTLVRKVPPGLEAVDGITCAAPRATSAASVSHEQITSEASGQKSSRRPSKKLIANGLLILGGLICLSRGHSSLGAKVAMAFILKKLTRHDSQSSQTRLS